MKRKVSKEERARQERLSGKLAKHEAAVKRTKSRLTRAFNAWQRAEAQLARTIKAIERPPEEEWRKQPGNALAVALADAPFPHEDLTNL